MRKEIYPDFTNANIASSLYSLGKLKLKNGKFNDSLSCFMKAIDIREKLKENNNPDIAKLYYCLGMCFSKLGDVEKALSYAKKSLDMRKSLFYKNHPKIADSLYLMGVIKEKLGMSLEANQYFKESCEIRKELVKTKNLLIDDSYVHFKRPISSLKSKNINLSISNLKLDSSPKNLIDQWSNSQVKIWLKENKIHPEIISSAISEDTNGQTLRQFYKMTIDTPEQFAQTLLIGTNYRIALFDINYFKDCLKNLFELKL